MEEGVRSSEGFNLTPIVNGSRITIGENIRTISIVNDKHFNKFQKYMIKWCFGFRIEDYSE